MSKVTLFLIIGLLFTSYGNARELSERELFYRCYSHLTGKRPALNSSLLEDVKEGTVTAVKACESVLDSASLNAQGRLQTPNVETKSVLNNLTKVHSGFFRNRFLHALNAGRARWSVDVFDELAPALAYTKALFDDSFNITQVLTYNTELEGLREEGQPQRGVSSRTPASEFMLRNPADANNESDVQPFGAGFSQVGDLIGVIPNRRARNKQRIFGPNKNFFNSSGGGIIGSRTYLKKNSSTVQANSDGATRMNRLIAKAVIEDFLCKALPATRVADGQTYTSSDADAVFRRSTGCIHCHTTMDMMAAGFRDIRSVDNSRNNPVFRYQFKRTPDRPDAELWPIKADNDYERRPPKGVLYFRSYAGDLIRENFNNLNQLGNRVLETDDYYACIAKKYYKHFTGINVSLADINDPFSTVKLNDQDLYHRNQVIQYGQELKSHRNPSALIKTILNSEAYKYEGFTLMQEGR